VQRAGAVVFDLDGVLIDSRTLERGRENLTRESGATWTRTRRGT